MLPQNPHLALRYWIMLLTIAFLSCTESDKYLNSTKFTVT